MRLIPFDIELEVVHDIVHVFGWVFSSIVVFIALYIAVRLLSGAIFRSYFEMKAYVESKRAKDKMHRKDTTRRCVDADA